MQSIKGLIIFLLLSLLSFNILSSGIGHFVHYVTYCVVDSDFHRDEHSQDCTHIYEHSHHKHSTYSQQILDITDSDLSRLRYLSLLMNTLKCALPDPDFMHFIRDDITTKGVFVVHILQGIEVETPTPPPELAGI